MGFKESGNIATARPKINKNLRVDYYPSKSTPASLAVLKILGCPLCSEGGAKIQGNPDGDAASPLCRPVKWLRPKKGPSKFESWPSSTGIGPGGGRTMGLTEGGEAGIATLYTCQLVII